MSTEFDPGQGTAPEPAMPDPGDGDRDADVLFLNPAWTPRPPRTAGTRAAAGGPRRCRRPPVTGRTTTTPATMTTWTVSRS